MISWGSLDQKCKSKPNINSENHFLSLNQGHSHGVYPLVFLPDGLDQSNMKGGGFDGDNNELLHQVE